MYVHFVPYTLGAWVSILCIEKNINAREIKKKNISAGLDVVQKNKAQMPVEWYDNTQKELRTLNCLTLCYLLFSFLNS